jgi:5-methylcytosine-specific restriction protein B
MFTWIEAHQAIAQTILSYRNKQQDLIEILKKVGIKSFDDQAVKGEATPLVEIDPFTFFSYIYKHSSVNNKKFLRKVCAELQIDIDVKDVCGVPSVMAQNVWLFPYKVDRNSNEINRLWNFFEKLLADTLTDNDFQDVLNIHSVGKPKLLDAMFRIKPYQYLCFNTVVNKYLREHKNSQPEFQTYQQLLDLQVKVQSDLNIDFPQLSYEAYLHIVYNEPPRFFRIGSKNGEAGTSMLPEMLPNNIASIGWDEIGDLEDLLPVNKSNIQNTLMAKGYYKDDKRTAARKAGEIFTFYDTILPFDYVFVADGASIKAIGQVISDNYLFLEDLEFPHCRNVRWIKIDINDLFIDEGLRTSVWQYQYASTIDKLKSYLGIGSVSSDNTDTGSKTLNKEKLPEFPLNIILYGPPGTGKTYNTIDKAVEIINGTSGNHEQNKATFDELVLQGNIAFVTFHQNYTYEDFIVGLKPSTKDQQLLFKDHEGIFYKMAKKALVAYEKSLEIDSEPDRYVLIIDEINRANISKVFGELITLLEEDKRVDGDNELSILLPNGAAFSLPPNLYIVGTMNTADKSIALIDVALRRRFEFIGMYPDSTVLAGKFSDRITFFEAINKNIYERRKNADFLIGHAYFLKQGTLEQIIDKKVIPLLMEYFNGRIEEVESLFDQSGYDAKYDSTKYKWTVVSKPIIDEVV